MGGMSSCCRDNKQFPAEVVVPLDVNTTETANGIIVAEIVSEQELVEVPQTPWSDTGKMYDWIVSQGQEINYRKGQGYEIAAPQNSQCIWMRKLNDTGKSNTTV